METILQQAVDNYDLSDLVNHITILILIMIILIQSSFKVKVKWRR